MKQGKAASSGPGARKVEPVCHPINVGAVSRIGAHQSNMSMNPHIEKGPAYQHPAPGGTTIHKTGGQGKH